MKRRDALDGLVPGEQAVVRRVGCAPAVARRLLEMGLLPGTLVTLVRTAPLGDPIELRLRGYHLSIRKMEAAAIEIERIEETLQKEPCQTPLPPKS